ncbi:MAG: hypothetical protein WC197_05075 [Candidatus Gastranaerophilaceae bacterium]
MLYVTGQTVPKTGRLLAKNESYNDGVLLSASHNLSIPNAVDSTLPCNSRFARKKEELQVRDDVRRIDTPDLLLLY